MDYSTLNLDLLRSLPIFDLTSGYKLQESSGNGCAGDPPGYPTYFTRCVYTARGNNPPHGSPQTVITVDDVNYVVDDGQIDYDPYKEHLHRLWKPLPIDHQRTLLWILSTYKHHQHCYNGHNRDLVIFPIPTYELKKFRPDPKWKDEFVEAHRVEVDEYNKARTLATQEIATPENHNAVRIIRRFYPEHQPSLELIANPPMRNIGGWWETEAEQPSEADCASTQRWGKKHPFNGAFCQWCGRRYPPSGA